MKEITVTFSIQDLNTVLDALAEQPYRVAAKIINAIQKQAREQMKEDAPADVNG